LKGMSVGELQAIWIKRARGGPMDAAQTARLVAGAGIVGNADQGSRRQVTVISAESWADAEEELGQQVDPRTRRANLLVRGVSLAASRGKVLWVGPVSIRIYGETRPCRQMEESCAGLQAALGSEWRGGVYGEVLNGGEVAAGDAVELGGELPL
jgi:MOSC domain-containing protein YiiM